MNTASSSKKHPDAPSSGEDTVDNTQEKKDHSIEYSSPQISFSWLQGESNDAPYADLGVRTQMRTL